MKRTLSTLLLLIFAQTLFAQSPQAIRESISRYPNLACPVASTYPSIPLGAIAEAPEGYEPFYFSLVGRHGSRYEQTEKRFAKACTVFDKAAERGILTDDGKLLHARLKAILAAQKGYNGEISALGVEQWQGIARRAYERFSAAFDKGSVEGKSSISLRCIFSMAAFNDGIKGCNPKIQITQNARASDLWIVRPLANDPSVSEEEKRIHKAYLKNGEWNKDREAWGRNADLSEFISKVTTSRSEFLDECGGKYDFRIARYAFFTLLFGENFGEGDRALLTKLFTPEEMYAIYVYQTAHWVNNSIGRGHDIVEMRQSHMRPLIEDIIKKGNEAIAGENPHGANVRFTHDSYMGPLYSVIGYDGCVPQYDTDLERAATSFNHGLIVPMASNLQVILYRNSEGKVLVRSLINERDATLPIKCKTAPFYPWEDFCNYARKNMDSLDKAAERVMKNRDK